MSATGERLLSLEDVADRLQVSDQSVRRWIKAGKLAAYKPGLEWRIRPSDLEDFLETHSSPKVQAALPSDDSPAARLHPTTYELKAIENTEGVCDRLERFLDVAGRRDIDHTYWRIETEHALDIVVATLPLIERDHLRPMLTSVAARLVELTNKMVEGLRDADADEEANQSRELVRELTRQINAA